MRQFTVKFRSKPISFWDKVFSVFGIHKFELGYFHRVGYSGTQKNNQPDIAIIETQNGHLITVPNNNKHYKLISYDK